MRGPARAAAAVFVGALALRLALIRALPTLPEGDSYARLLRPRIALGGPWLPGYEALVVLTRAVSHDPQALRAMTATVGALAAAAAFRAGYAHGGARAGAVAGIGLAALPAFVLPSVGLYAEPLMLLGLAVAAWGLPAPERAMQRAGLVALGLACLVRYEAWLVAGVAAVALVRTRGAYRDAAACLAVPAMLLALAPLGGAWSHLDPGVSTQRVVDRVALLSGLAADLHLLPLLAAATAGALYGRRPRLLLALAAAELALLAFLDPYAPSGNPRQIVLPLALAVALAARWASAGALPTVVALGAVLAGALAYPMLLAHYADEAELPAAVARAMRPGLEGGTQVLVRAEGLRGWPDADAPACEVVQAYAPVGAVRCDHAAGLDATVDYVVRFGDYVPWRATDAALDAGLRDWVVVVDAPGTATLLARSADAAARVDAGAIQTALARWPTGPCASADPTPLLPEAIRTGAAVRAEGGRVAFFTDGTLTFSAERTGTLALDVCGTPAAGRQPVFDVTTAAGTQSFTAPPRVTRVVVGAVRAGVPVTLRYADDAVAPDGADRNLYLRGVTFTP